MNHRIASTINNLSRYAYAISKVNRCTINFNKIILTAPFRSVMYSSIIPKLETMKLESSHFKSIFNPELETLIELFKKHNYELRIAGGAVRDLLSGKVPQDIDFATIATPSEMKDMFDKESIRMLNMKGEKHGTITCRINDKENFEVTTLRIDVVTDGRHAEVEFTRDWEQDALRRDLTINSMFLGFDGTVYDYFRGAEDLSNCKVRFVGDPVARIQEDYLRILRYFRFYGRVANDANIHEADTLKAIRDNMHGLKGISGERIWIELKKIVTGHHSGPIIRIMLELGMAQYVGLPSKCNVAEFEKVWTDCKDLNPLPMTLLATLFSEEQQVSTFHERIKLSRDELRLATFILTFRSDTPDKLFDYCADLLCDVVAKEPKSKERICELLKYWNERPVLQQFSEWQAPKFPVSGFHLLEAGVPKGPKLAKTLNQLRAHWRESRYTKTQEELIVDLDNVIKSISDADK